MCIYILPAGNQSNAVTLPSDVEVIVDSSNGLNEGSSAVNGNLENEDSLYTVGKICIHIHTYVPCTSHSSLQKGMMSCTAHGTWHGN